MKWINRIVDMPKLVKRVWLVLWAMLFIAVFMKFCFNIWYPIVIENQMVINICDFIDNNIIFNYSIRIIFYLLNFNLVFLISIAKTKYKNKIFAILMNLLVIANFFIKTYFNGIGTILELIGLIIVPIFINIKSSNFVIYRKNKLLKHLANILFPIIVYGIVNLWQMNILFVRGINEVLTVIPFAISLILQIDYYIFLIISMIGARYTMGNWGIGWWWGKSTTELEAIKATELKKTNPDAKLIADIDKELERRTNEIKNKAA